METPFDYDKRNDECWEKGTTEHDVSEMRNNGICTHCHLPAFCHEY